MRTANCCLCYLLFTRQRALRTPRWQKVRDGFEISTSVPLEVQKSEPGSAEQVQSDQVSISGGKERPQSVCGEEKSRPWTRPFGQRGLQRWLPWSTSASTPGPSRFPERLGERHEARTAASQDQVEGSIIKVDMSLTAGFDLL